MFLCSLLKIAFLCGHPYHADFKPFVGQRTRVLVLLKKSKLWPPTLQASTLLTYLTIKNTFTDEMMSFNFAKLVLAPAKFWTSLVLKLYFRKYAKAWRNVTATLETKTIAVLFVLPVGFSRGRCQKIHSTVTNKKRVRERKKKDNIPCLLLLSVFLWGSLAKFCLALILFL